MTLKEILKSLEGIVVLSAFTAVILTGANIFAYLGIGGYIVVNVNKGVEKVKYLYKKVSNYVKSLLKKEVN